MLAKTLEKNKLTRKEQYGRISRAYENEPIIIVEEPSNTNTIMWQALVLSMKDGVTTCRRYMDAYAEIGSSCGSLNLTEWIHMGLLAFASPEMRLVPGGNARRLVHIPKQTQSSLDFTRPVVAKVETPKAVVPVCGEVRFYMVSGPTEKLSKLEEVMTFTGLTFEVS